MVTIGTAATRKSGMYPSLVRPRHAIVAVSLLWNVRSPISNAWSPELDLDILAEQERVKIHDPTHFAYPIYAKASAFRRDNLKRSADEFRVQLAKANEALSAIG